MAERLTLTLGLSPLARGNRVHEHGGAVFVGPIPARAGQPPSPSSCSPATRAYPRSRGATHPFGCWLCPFEGLSPLARGNHRQSRLHAGWRGPIPARAGQPPTDDSKATLWRAYPRSRGATDTARREGIRALGLSPLARGNRRWRRGCNGAPRPIPARAGQPLLEGEAHVQLRAYPRSRGATRAGRVMAVMLMGLSPLARGNRQAPALQRSLKGPIPARAGQPAGGSGAGDEEGAYPRSRGATVGEQVGVGAGAGLSPLARGNPPLGERGVGGAGPIPARAGQPGAPARLARRRRAYPRSRGATDNVDVFVGGGSGLSPLARGNRGPGRGGLSRSGPIPARAGQPSINPDPLKRAGAYPRSRGATPMPAPAPVPIQGLSPLARGNRPAPWFRRQ